MNSKMTSLLFLGLFQLVTTTVLAQNALNGRDVLISAQVEITAQDFQDVLDKTENDVRSFAENFQIILDSKSKIKKQKEVLGSLLEPVMTITVRKCVFIVCQSIDLDAQFRLERLEVLENEKCSSKYKLSVDLSRSSAMLSDLYAGIDSEICISQNKAGANALLKTELTHAANYQEGLVQRQAFDLIKLQGQAILSSFISVMKKFGATSVVVKSQQ